MQIDVPDELIAEVAAVAEHSGTSAEALVAESLVEALKMRRVPGVLFVDGATGRRARIAGTGIDVFEVADAFVVCDRDVSRLERELPQLQPEQIRVALRYYEAYPEDIEPRLRSDDAVAAELAALWDAHPHTSPGWRTRQHSAQPQSEGPISERPR